MLHTFGPMTINSGREPQNSATFQSFFSSHEERIQSDLNNSSAGFLTRFGFFYFKKPETSFSREALRAEALPFHLVTHCANGAAAASASGPACERKGKAAQCLPSHSHLFMLSCIFQCCAVKIRSALI